MPLLAQACGPASQASLAAILDSYQGDDRQLVGWCDPSGPLALAGMEIRDHAAKLVHLAIRSDLRRRGLGRQLLQAIQSQFGLYRMDAETDAEALGFYQALGWAHVALGHENVYLPRFGVYWLAAEKILQSDFCFPAPKVDQVRLPGFDDLNISLLRLDQIHPLLSGNKWFKLSGNLIAARQAGLDTLLTLGGAWSNHLIATSAAGKLLGFKTIGLVRCEISEPLNPCLQFCQANGMLLKAVSRGDYRLYRKAAGLDALADCYPQAWLIPEGGSNPQALTGLAHIISMLPVGTKTLALACGTATTLAGLAAAAPESISVLGVAVLPRADFLRQQVQDLLAQAPASPASPWRIETGFSLGGYARRTPELDAFLIQFSGLNPGVALEPVYTGKLIYAITQLLKANQLDANGLVLIHTGGLPLGRTPST